MRVAVSICALAASMAASADSLSISMLIEKQRYFFGLILLVDQSSFLLTLS
jgi:hypothetical protein